jgi:hypothetical protein
MLKPILLATGTAAMVAIGSGLMLWGAPTILNTAALSTETIIGITFGLYALSFIITLIIGIKASKILEMPYHIKFKETREKIATVFGNEPLSILENTGLGYCGYISILVGLHMKGDAFFKAKVEHMIASVNQGVQKDLEALNKLVLPKKGELEDAKKPTETVQQIAKLTNTRAADLDVYLKDMRANPTSPKQCIWLLLRYIDIQRRYRNSEASPTLPETMITNYDNPQALPIMLPRALYIELTDFQYLKGLEVNVIALGKEDWLAHDIPSTPANNNIFIKNTGGHWVNLVPKSEVNKYEQQLHANSV